MSFDKQLNNSIRLAVFRQTTSYVSDGRSSGNLSLNDEFDGLNDEDDDIASPPQYQYDHCEDNWNSKLMKAARDVNLIGVQEALHNKADVCAKDSYDCTALHMAAENNNCQIVELLIENCTNCDDLFKIGNYKGNSALHIAAYSNRSDIIDLILKSCTNIEALISLKNHKGLTPLHFACLHDCRGSLEALIKHKTCQNLINSQDDMGRTPMIILYSKNEAKVSAKIMPLIMKYCYGVIDFDIKDISGRCVFDYKHKIIANNRPMKSSLAIHTDDCCDELLSIPTLRQLIEADECTTKLHDLLSEKIDETGICALHYIVIHNNIKMAELLFKKTLLKKPDIDFCISIKDVVNEWTPIHYAARHGFYEIIQLLLSNCSAPDEIINMVDKDGSTSLHLAARSGKIDVVIVLLNASKNKDSYINVKDVDESTALHKAARSGYKEVVEKLIEFSLNLEDYLRSREKNGFTPLCLAARNGHVEVCQTLLALSSDPNEYILIEDNEGWTALHHAANFGNADVGELILTFCTNPTALIDRKNSTSRNALYLALANNKQDVLKIFLSKCADPFVLLQEEYENGEKVFEICSSECKLECYREFLKNADFQTNFVTNLNDKYFDNSTTLHLAVRLQNSNLVARLLSTITDTDELVQAKDSSGRTALHWACFYADYHSIQKILDCSFDESGLNQKDFDENTCWNLLFANNEPLNLGKIMTLLLQYTEFDNKIDSQYDVSQYSHFDSLMRNFKTIDTYPDTEEKLWKILGESYERVSKDSKEIDMVYCKCLEKELSFIKEMEFTTEMFLQYLKIHYFDTKESENKELVDNFLKSRHIQYEPSEENAFECFTNNFLYLVSQCIINGDKDVAFLMDLNKFDELNKLSTLSAAEINYIFCCTCRHIHPQLLGKNDVDSNANLWEIFYEFSYFTNDTQFKKNCKLFLTFPFLCVIFNRLNLLVTFFQLAEYNDIIIHLVFIRLVLQNIAIQQNLTPLKTKSIDEAMDRLTERLAFLYERVFAYNEFVANKFVLERKNELLGGFTIVNIALKGNCLDLITKGVRKSEGLLTTLVSLVKLPALMGNLMLYFCVLLLASLTYFHSKHNLSNMCREKRKLLFTTELKFKLDRLSHFFFLIILTYFVTRDFHYSLSRVEILAYIYIVTIFVEELKQIYTTIQEKTLENYTKDILNLIDMLFFSFSFIAFGIRTRVLYMKPNCDSSNYSCLSDEAINHYLFSARVCFVVATILTYMKFLRNLTLNETLGPTIKMIIEMIRIDLIPFLAILSVFLCAFGTAFAALLYPNGISDSRMWNSTSLDMFSLSRGFVFSFYTMVGDFTILSLTESVDGDTEEKLGKANERGKPLITYIFLVIYVIMVNILLLNLLIALFSRTIEILSNKKLLIWHTFRLNVIEEYKSHSALPPPFNLFDIIFDVLDCTHKRNLYKLYPALKNEKLAKQLYYNDCVKRAFYYAQARALKKERKYELNRR